MFKCNDIKLLEKPFPLIFRMGPSVYCIYRLKCFYRKFTMDGRTDTRNQSFDRSFSLDLFHIRQNRFFDDNPQLRWSWWQRTSLYQMTWLSARPKWLPSQPTGEQSLKQFNHRSDFQILDFKFWWVPFSILFLLGLSTNSFSLYKLLRYMYVAASLENQVV